MIVVGRQPVIISSRHDEELQSFILCSSFNEMPLLNHFSVEDCENISIQIAVFVSRQY